MSAFAVAIGGQSGHVVLRCICPLMTQSGHRMDMRPLLFNQLAGGGWPLMAR